MSRIIHCKAEHLLAINPAERLQSYIVEGHEALGFINSAERADVLGLFGEKVPVVRLGLSLGGSMHCHPERSLSLHVRWEE